MIDRFIPLIPGSLISRSGAVLYSGRVAFASETPLYILGSNPGGDSVDLASETLEKHTSRVLNHEEQNWSAYRDEVWRAGSNAGSSGMQPRVLHMLDSLDLNPGLVPSSNLVFVRSRQESDIADEYAYLADLCWPFHRRVIDALSIKVVLCFGQTCGNYVRRKLDAAEQVDEMVENNNRRWRTTAFRSSSAIAVVVATHPSRADWTNRNTDPTELVRRRLANSP